MWSDLMVTFSTPSRLLWGGKISEEMRHVSAMSTQFNKYAALDVRSFGSNSTVAIKAKGKNDFLSFSRWRRAISLPFSCHTHSAL